MAKGDLRGRRGKWKLLIPSIQPHHLLRFCHPVQRCGRHLQKPRHRRTPVSQLLYRLACSGMAPIYSFPCSASSIMSLFISLCTNVPIIPVQEIRVSGSSCLPRADTSTSLYRDRRRLSLPEPAVCNLSRTPAVPFRRKPCLLLALRQVASETREPPLVCHNVFESIHRHFLRHPPYAIGSFLPRPEYPCSNKPQSREPY